jgi:hypothetical protein
MTGYISKSFHDLFVEESEAISDSSSSRGSHHPSWVCSMAGVPEGRVKDAQNSSEQP